MNSSIVAIETLAIICTLKSYDFLLFYKKDLFKMFENSGIFWTYKWREVNKSLKWYLIDISQVKFSIEDHRGFQWDNNATCIHCNGHSIGPWNGDWKITIWLAI